MSAAPLYIATYQRQAMRARHYSKSKEKVSASTQNQALSALLLLYCHVPGRDVGDLGDVVRARKPKRLPVVLTREEVNAVLAQLNNTRM